MKNWKLHNRILFLVLLPGLIVSVFLGSFFTINRMHNLDFLLQERGLAIIKQVASTSEYGVISGNNLLLASITNNLLEEKDLQSARILNKDGEVLAHSGPKILDNNVGNTELKNNHLQLSRTDDSIRLKAPIFSQNIGLMISDIEPQYMQQRIATDLLGWVEIEMSLSNTELQKYQHLALSITVVSITMLIFFILAIRISRSISKPIHDMMNCVEDISNGKVDSRVYVNSDDEFQKLAVGLNAMAIAIQRTKTEHAQNIEQATHDIRETLETIEIQNIELDMARKEAIEGSRIKSEFLTNISHEIRTPLNGILGFTRILLKDLLLKDLLIKDQSNLRSIEHLNTIEKSANSLLAIINDILDFSKIDAGKLILEKIDFNVRNILEEVLTLNAPEAHKKSLELVNLVYSDVPSYLTGDPLRLKQILTNLISNAIKFTQQGCVTIRVMIVDENTKQATIKFEITDTGIGINNQQKDKLFKSFSQADSSTSRKFGGTGLGLVISEHLVKAMNGEIGLTSVEGEGSVFYFSAVLKKSRRLDQPKKALKDTHILIAETDKNTRLGIMHLLKEWQIHYHDRDTSDSLLEDFNAKDKNTPAIDAAILGLSRKELYSPSTIDFIQQMNRQNIPVILLINSTISEELEYGQTLGAYKCLSKPLQSEGLFNNLCKALGKDIATTETVDQNSSNASVYDSNNSSLNTNQMPPPSILIVDDNEPNLKLIEILLNDMNINTITAESGTDAILKLEQQDVDMIFMDIQMPGMNGLETTQVIRKTKTINELPIIALTAHAISDEKNEILKSGMNDYQTKPINNDQLIQCIERWTGYRADLNYIETVQAKQESSEQKSSNQQTSSIQVNHSEIFDAKLAMSHANNKLDLAIDLFDMLLDSLTVDLQEIEQLWQEQKQQGLLQKVHKTHGATRYCGTPGLMHAMENLEIALKKNDLSDCDNLYHDAIHEIIKLKQWAQKNQWQDELKNTIRTI